MNCIINNKQRTRRRDQREKEKIIDQYEQIKITVLFKTKQSTKHSKSSKHPLKGHKINKD